MLERPPPVARGGPTRVRAAARGWGRWRSHGKQKPDPLAANRVACDHSFAFWRGAFSQRTGRQRPPFCSSGRRSVFYCALSRLFYSLSSAGNVCWAKPNHGFSTCQQPDAIFFWPGSRPELRAWPRRSSKMSSCVARVALRTLSACTESTYFQGLYCNERIRARDRRHDAMCAQRLSHGTGNRFRCTCLRVRVDPPFSRRTSRFARNCAKIFRCRRCRRGRDANTWREKTRAVADAGFAFLPVAAARLNGRRLPAIRRNRPAPAARSVAPAPRSRR